MKHPLATRFWAPFALVSLVMLGCGGGSKPSVEQAAADAEAEEAKAPAPELTPSGTPDMAKAPAQTPQPPPPQPPPPIPTPEPAATSRPPAVEPIATPEVTEGAKDKDADAKAKPKPVDDPLKWLQESEAKKAEYNQKVAVAQGKVSEADAQVAEWEKNLLAFKIPYRARPVLNQKDSDELTGKGGADRVHWAEDKLAEAHKARDEAQKALDDLRANPPQ